MSEYGTNATYGLIQDEAIGGEYGYVAQALSLPEDIRSRLQLLLTTISRSEPTMLWSTVSHRAVYRLQQNLKTDTNIYQSLARVTELLKTPGITKEDFEKQMGMYINAGNKKIVLPVISRALFPKIELAKRQREFQSIANSIEPASSWKRAYKSFAIAYNTSAHHNNPFYLPLSTKGNGSVFQVYSIPVSPTALRELFGGLDLKYSNKDDAIPTASRSRTRLADGLKQENSTLQDPIELFGDFAKDKILNMQSGHSREILSKILPDEYYADVYSDGSIYFTTEYTRILGSLDNDIGDILLNILADYNKNLKKKST